MRPPKKATPRTIRFGRNLARLRNQAGLTQEALAEKAGISARYVQDLEAGLYSPTIWVVEALRKALEVSWLDVLHGLGKLAPQEISPVLPETSFPAFPAQPVFMPKTKPDKPREKRPR